MRRIALAVGGTGGHILPALQLAKELKKQGVEVHFLGAYLENNPYLDKSFPYGSVLGSNRCPMKLVKGVWQSLSYLRKNKISLVVGFGSYHSMPPVAAATLLRVPFVLCEANLLPGRVNRLFSRMAKWTAVQFIETSKHVKTSTKWIDFLGEKFRNKKSSKAVAAHYFGLSEEIPTILVVGGSHGASSINQKMMELLPTLEKPFQVIHLIGKKESPEVVEKVYREANIPHVVKSFEENMHHAYTLSSFAIARAGAATLAELIHFELPALLIPYPFATDQHQSKNGIYFAEVLRGGDVLEEKDLSLMKEKVLPFFDPHFLKEKQSALASYPVEHRYSSLYQCLLEFF